MNLSLFHDGANDKCVLNDVIIYIYYWCPVKFLRSNGLNQRSLTNGRQRPINGGDTPDGALPLFIGGGDRFAVRGCRNSE